MVGLLATAVLLCAAAPFVILRSTHPAPPLLIGIYPGGSLGTVGEPVAAVADEPAARMSALNRLRGTAARRFMIRLYSAYIGGADAGADPELLAQIGAYAAAGYEVELVLTYRPGQADADGFAAHVSDVVAQVGPMHAVTSLQVANEVNATVGTDASDGTHPGAREALVRGILAAHAAVRAGGYDDHLRVGFNVADASDRDLSAFWRALHSAGGPDFAKAVDWVGIDLYPGTWGPSLASGPLELAVRTHVTAALRRLREDLLPIAGLGDGVALHVAESGYPTGPGRSEADQRTVATALVRAVSDDRAATGVTQLCWFDLRDADSASASTEAHYGLLRSDGTPKPAFSTFRSLVARYGPSPRRD